MRAQGHLASGLSWQVWSARAGETHLTVNLQIQGVNFIIVMKSLLSPAAWFSG